MRIERLKFLGSFSVAICDDKNFKPIYIYFFFFSKNYDWQQRDIDQII